MVEVIALTTYIKEIEYTFGFKTNLAPLSLSFFVVYLPAN